MESQPDSAATDAPPPGEDGVSKNVVALHEVALAWRHTVAVSVLLAMLSSSTIPSITSSSCLRMSNSISDVTVSSDHRRHPKGYGPGNNPSG